MSPNRSGLLPAAVPLLFACLLALCLPAVPWAGDWTLVWSDEFAGAALDTTRWNVVEGNGCPDLCGWGNEELEFYRAGSVSVVDGCLVLTADVDTAGTFVSGKVTTRDKVSFLYGRLEVRARLPLGDGMWPAFWLLPEDTTYGGWAASGEIDVMEAANDMTAISGSLHFGGRCPYNVCTTSSYAPPGICFADSFHVYAVDWEPDRIRWYVDGQLYGLRTSDQWYSDGAPDDPRAPFDRPFHLILNLAVGGNFTGCTEPGCITTDLPQQFVIDYVRVYRRPTGLPRHSGGPTLLPGYPNPANPSLTSRLPFPKLPPDRHRHGGPRPDPSHERRCP